MGFWLKKKGLRVYIKRLGKFFGFIVRMCRVFFLVLMGGYGNDVFLVDMIGRCWRERMKVNRVLNFWI